MKYVKLEKTASRPNFSPMIPTTSTKGLKKHIIPNERNKLFHRFLLSIMLGIIYEMNSCEIERRKKKREMTYRVW